MNVSVMHDDANNFLQREGGPQHPRRGVGEEGLDIVANHVIQTDGGGIQLLDGIEFLLKCFVSLHELVAGGWKGSRFERFIYTDLKVQSLINRSLIGSRRRRLPVVCRQL